MYVETNFIPKKMFTNYGKSNGKKRICELVLSFINLNSKSNSNINIYLYYIYLFLHLFVMPNLRKEYLEIFII